MIIILTSLCYLSWLRAWGQLKSVGAGSSTGSCDTADGLYFVCSQIRLHKSTKFVFILSDAVKYMLC